uniref:protein-serine/threonine phosphatase n=1 Tax=Ditylenchus dipsaci TaxID=166011 RepID=A0A915CQM6_9BILA
MPVAQIEAEGWRRIFYGLIPTSTLEKMSSERLVRILSLVLSFVMKNGYGFFAGRKLVTIFSAPRYIKELNNRAAILRVNSSLVCSFVLLNPVTKETAGPEHFRKTFKDESTAYSSAE